MVMRNDLSARGYLIAALEQTGQSIDLSDFKPPSKIALIVGNEIDGIDRQTLDMVETCIQIPMWGKKESFNVAVAAAMALYHLRYS
jgi:tRNA G18 (ribose-2'-O)-methylase SpoU